VAYDEDQKIKSLISSLWGFKLKVEIQGFWFLSEKAVFDDVNNRFLGCKR
jgi:hypothetical protein